MNEYRTHFQTWLDSIPKVERMILFTLGKVHDDGDSERLRKDRTFADSLNGLRSLILKKDHSPENWQSILEAIAHLPVDDKLYFLEDVIANNFSQEERKKIFACASANANERLSRIQKYVLGVKTLESSLSEDNLQRVFDAQKRVEEKEQ